MHHTHTHTNTYTHAYVHTSQHKTNYTKVAQLVYLKGKLESSKIDCVITFSINNTVPISKFARKKMENGTS